MTSLLVQMELDVASRLREGNAKLREELEAVTKERDEALARIKASQEQEPIYQCWQASVGCWQDCSKIVYEGYEPDGYAARIVYKLRVIPPTEAELLAEIERLKAIRHQRDIDDSVDKALMAKQVMEDMYLKQLTYSKELEAQLAAANSRINVLNAANVQQAEEIERLKAHDQQVRDEAYERAARKVVHCDDRHKAAEAIRNLKGTK